MVELPKDYDYFMVDLDPPGSGKRTPNKEKVYQLRVLTGFRAPRILFLGHAHADIKPEIPARRGVEGGGAVSRSFF